MRPILLLFAIQGLSALLLFAFLLWRRRKRLSVATDADIEDETSYVLLSKGTKLKALRRPAGFGFASSLTYVGAFYWAAPVFIWRYGVFLTIWILAMPIGIAAAAHFVLNAVLEALIQTEFDSIALIAMVPIRAAFGLHVGSNDGEFRRRILEQRGWQYVATRRAKSVKAALAMARPEK